MTKATAVPLDAKAIDILWQVTTATLITFLLKKGLRNAWLRGTRPLRPGQPRQVGRTFTLRFVPAGEDPAIPESWSSPISTRAAIEDMPADCNVGGTPMVLREHPFPNVCTGAVH